MPAARATRTPRSGRLRACGSRAMRSSRTLLPLPTRSAARLPALRHRTIEGRDRTPERSMKPDDAPKYFLCRLIPPRPTFAADMTPTELDAMQKHVAYWTDLASRGTAIAFGPVADPKGAWGVGIIAVRDEEELRRLQDHDPAIRAGIGMKYEAYPMPRVIVGATS